MTDRIEALKHQRALIAAELVGWTQAILGDGGDAVPGVVLDTARRIVAEYETVHNELSTAIREALDATLSEQR